MQSNHSASINGPSILDLVAHAAPRGRQLEAELPFGALLETPSKPQPAAPSSPPPSPASQERPSDVEHRSPESAPQQSSRPVEESAAVSDSETTSQPGASESTIAEDASESGETAEAEEIVETDAAAAEAQAAEAAAALLAAALAAQNAATILSKPAGSIATDTEEQLPAELPSVLLEVAAEVPPGASLPAVAAAEPGVRAAELADTSLQTEALPAALSPAEAELVASAAPAPESTRDASTEPVVAEAAPESIEPAAASDPELAGETEIELSDQGGAGTASDEQPQPDELQQAPLEASTPAAPPPAPPGEATSGSVSSGQTNPAAGIIPAAVESGANRQRLPAAILGTSSGQGNRPAGELDVDSVRLLQRVARAFAAAHERGSEIRLRLTPPELGAIRLEVQMQDGAMVANVETETAAARTAIVENLAALRERLAEQGVRIERFEVDLMNRQSGGLDQRASDQEPQSSDRRPAPATTLGREAPTPAARQSVVALEPGRLNVIV